MTMKAKQAIHFDQNTFYISGDLTFATAVKLWKASQTLFPQQAIWTCDFSQVQTCDSAGLALILEWIKFAKRQHKPIHLLQLPPQLHSIAGAAGLNQLLEQA